MRQRCAENGVAKTVPVCSKIRTSSDAPIYRGIHRRRSMVRPSLRRVLPPSPPQSPVEQLEAKELPGEHWSSRLVHAVPADFTLTTLGGSSSCFIHGYGEHIRNYSTGNVTWWNPSQGSTGTDWAALFIDSLVPARSHVVLWEFAIVRALRLQSPPSCPRIVGPAVPELPSPY